MEKEYCFYCRLFKKEKVEAEYVIRGSEWRNLEDDSVVLAPPYRTRYCCADCMEKILAGNDRQEE